MVAPSPPRRRWWPPVAAGAATGAAIFLSDFPVHAWWLQAVALAPWLWAVARWRPGAGVGALSGAALGLCYTGPLSLALAFPWHLGLALALYVTAFWALLGAGAAWLLRARERGPGGAVGAALAVASLAALVEWLNTSVIPVWGTAQVFTRVWSAAPRAIQITSITGVLGLVWAVFAVQTLAAIALAGARGTDGDEGGAARTPRSAAIALVVTLAAVAVGNALLWPRTPRATLRAAAVGWTYDDLPAGRTTPWRQTWREVALPLVERAAAQGAALVVTPETGVSVPAADADEFRAAVAAAARAGGAFLAVGWFDEGHNDNRILLMAADGRPRGEYRKTHLIMTVESYRPGDGTLVVTPLGDLRLGGMICQDDNYTDLSRGYGRRGAHIVAVPTNDWREVADYHLENSVFRAVDSRYAVVRAATNGWSALITARGEVVARVDHFARGAALVVADLPIYAPGSIYSRVGDWIVVLPCALWLAVLIGLRARARRRA